MAKRGRRPGDQTQISTKLAAWRVHRGMTQAEVASAVGISLTAYRRIERGHPNPSLRVLNNCAIVLGCELEDLLGEELLEWYAVGKKGRPPLDPRKLWRENRNDIHRTDLAEKVKGVPLPPPPE